MTTRGDALDQALGLLRAPSLRAALRERPLPRGVTEVLSIAGGSTDSLREAAARTGYAEAELVEASRFYVLQVLLAEDADAYRVLGAARDAGSEQLRNHHRLLLRWLHPDRAGDEQWSSALSTRINSAWQQLRNEQVRGAYDQLLAEQPAPAGFAPGIIRRRGRSTHGDGGGVARGNRHAPIAVAMLAVACIALAWLALQRESRLDAERDASIASIGAGPPDMADAFAGVQADARATASAPVPTTRAASAAAPVQLEPIEDEPAVSQTEPEPSRRDASIAVADTWSYAPAPAPRPVERDRAPDAGAASFAAPAPRLPRRRASAAPAQAAGAAAASSPSTPLAPEPRVPEDTTDPLQLMRQARLAADQALAYLGSGDGGGAVAWNDAPIADASEQLRTALHARLGGNGRDRRLRLQSPDWRLDARRATLNGRYRVGGAESGHLHLELARRDARWWVTALRLEPAQ